MVEFFLVLLIIGYLIIAFSSNHIELVAQKRIADKVKLQVAVMRIKEGSVYENKEEVLADKNTEVKVRESGERPSAVLRRQRLLARAKELGVDVSELEKLDSENVERTLVAPILNIKIDT